MLENYKINWFQCAIGTKTLSYSLMSFLPEKQPFCRLTIFLHAKIIEHIMPKVNQNCPHWNYWSSQVLVLCLLPEHHMVCIMIAVLGVGHYVSHLNFSAKFLYFSIPLISFSDVLLLSLIWIFHVIVCGPVHSQSSQWATVTRFEFSM